MNCPNCQAELPDGVKFCPSCGSSLEAVIAEPVQDVVMPVEEAIEQIPSVDENLSSEIPNGAFDPGAPIAVPKKKEEPVVEEVVPVVAPVEAVPEVAPVESVLPEYPQTPAPAAEPVAAPVAPAPIPAAPVAPAPVPAPVAPPVSLTPESVPAPVASDKNAIQAGSSAGIPDKKSELKAMSTGTAFWLMLLFSIPVIGFIFSIILSCVGKKCKSRKNFARAVLIWNIIAIIIALALVIVCYFLFKDIFEAAMSGDFNAMSEEIQDLFNIG